MTDLRIALPEAAVFPRYNPRDCPHNETTITMAQLHQLAAGKAVRCKGCGWRMNPPQDSRR